MTLQYQDIFKRYEKKYMLSQLQCKELLKQLKAYMTIDGYGMHTICNIYFDTDNYDLIRTSIEKPLYKEKLRIRSYGVPKPSDTVFLELKKKYQGIVYKRRVQLPLKEAQLYLLRNKQPQVSSQIIREIDWFLNRYQPVPKAYISYDRCALFGKEDSNLRITFDQNILFRDSYLDLSKGNWGQPLLESGNILMEIKIPGSMPLWLSHMLTELEIFPTSFSKYGNCYKEHMVKDHFINEIYPKGGIICA